MPALIALFMAAEITASLVAAAVIEVITLASFAYSAYMMATAKSPNQNDANGRMTTVRSSVQPHRMVYGECMTGGALIYAQSHDMDPLTLMPAPYVSLPANKYISLVVAFTGHEVEEIKEVWLNDRISTDIAFQTWVDETAEEGYWTGGLDTQGNPNGDYIITKAGVPAHYDSLVHVSKYLGTLDQEADPFLLTVPPNPVTIISKYPTSGLSDMTVPPDPGTFSGIGMAVFTITIASVGAVDTFDWVETVYEGDGTTIDVAASNNESISGSMQLLTAGVFVQFGAVTGHSLGQTWEVRAYDGAPWTAECKLTNRSYVVVTLQKSDQVFPTGLPNITALIRGNNQIYDPRTSATGYSDNWALCVRDYLTKPYGLNAPAGDINGTVAGAAANSCDENVTLTNGNTQKRYTMNGSFTVDKTPTAIMNEMLATAYGAITWTQGQYRILPAIYYTPDMTFHGLNASIPGLTESDLRGSIKVRPMVSMKDKFNCVRGTFISPETWQPVDFPIVKNDMYIAEDAGKEIGDITQADRIPKDIQLSYVTDAAMAQRVAKIMLEKGRQGIVVDFPAMWSAFPLAVGDTVPITIAHLGWSQKIFTVLDWALNPEGGVDLSLKEDAEGIYAWDNGEETTVDLAPNTNIKHPSFVPAVTGFTVGEELYSGNVGSIPMSRAILTWDDMNLSQYEINYKPPTNTIWTPLPFTTNTTAVIDNITPGLYSYRVRGMNSMLAWGPWATIDGTLTGKEGLPPDVNVFIVTPQQDGTRTFSWLMNNPPIDLAGYKIRYSDVDTSTWPDMVELFSGLMVASPYETNQLPAGDYIFGIIAVDTTGNESANPNYCTITLPNPRLSDVWASSVAQSGVWPGTKTNCSIAADGTLVANESVSGDTWDTMPATWDTTYQWLNPAGTIGYGVPAIDLGASLTFTPMVYSIGVGTIVNQMATSSDGTTWSSFGAIVRATARYVKFLVTAEATLPIIASLHSVAVYIVIKPITEEINDLNTSTLSGVHHISAGDIRLPLVNTYLVIKQVSLTLQNVGPGWTWELIDKNLTNGPRVKIYNASGVLADAVIDAYIKGA